MSSATPETAAVKLDFALPAQPRSLMRLSALIRDPAVDLPAISEVIETDMALAASVMKTVNSPFYGLRDEVLSVQKAVAFLGMRELTAIAMERGLRESFPDVPALHAVWDRARLRGALMGRLAQALNLEAWSAHSAGLFEECGKALLYAHDPAGYGKLLQWAVDDLVLREAEQREYGVGHDELGAQLCEQWGMSPASVASVRFHIEVQSTHALPRVPHRYVCVMSALADTLMRQPDQIEAVTDRLAPQAMMDRTSLLRHLERIRDKLDELTTGA